MITYLKGLLAEKHPTRLVVEVAGVGYEVFIPLSSYDRLPGAGEPCRILTYDYVREEVHQLFGFVTEGERKMFVQLMGTSGVGPRLALSALSGMSVRELRAAIAAGDVKRLSSISGIGRKMAERIVVELRDKIDAADALDAVAGAEDVSQETLLLRDAVLALVALGYKQETARAMVLAAAKRGPADAGVEDVIKAALGSAS